MKIIDGHAHICEYINGLGSEGELIPIGNGYARYASGKTVKMIPDGLGDKGFTYQSLIKVMDQYSVSKAVLLQGHYLGLQNLYTHEASIQYPDRFVGACMFDPYSAHYEKIYPHLFDVLGFKILKLELSNGSGIMSNHLPFDINNDRMNEIYQIANEKNITIVFDIGRPQNPCWQVDNLVSIIKAYPSIQFVVCHLLACPNDSFDLLKESIDKFKGLKNVAFDIASVMNNTKEEYPYPNAQKYIRYTLDTLGINSIIWGTDIPCGINKNSYYSCIHYIMDSNLFTENEKEHIFYKNANLIYFNQKETQL